MSSRAERSDWKSYAWAVAGVAAITAIGLVVSTRLPRVWRVPLASCSAARVSTRHTSPSGGSSESGALAGLAAKKRGPKARKNPELIKACCKKQRVARDQLTIHADRGSPMTAK